MESTLNRIRKWEPFPSKIHREAAILDFLPYNARKKAVAKGSSWACAEESYENTLEH